jgi:hypothetical protein
MTRQNEEIKYSRNIQRHLINLSIIELLNISQHPNILRRHKVDRNSLPTESSSTTNSVDVVFAVGGKIVVDDERDLQQISVTSSK